MKSTSCSYSCDELYYKYPDVLWLVGEQAEMQINVYSCRRDLASHAVAIAWRTGAR